MAGLTLEQTRERCRRDGSWDMVLSWSEVRNLNDYETQFGIMNGTYQLKDCVRNGFAVTCKSGVTMYTLIHSASLHYNVRRGNRRPLQGSELALLQGFPVLQRLACPGGVPRAVCSYARPRAVRPYRTVNEQAGNSQQVPVVGAMLLYSLLFISVNPPDRFLAFAAARRRAVLAKAGM